MNYYFITGASRGIGKSLAEIVLMDKNTHVTGLSRSACLEHINYEHVKIDLSDLDAVQAFEFPALPNATSITLVNNSGVLGHVAHVGKVSNTDIIRAFNINTTAASILTNNFAGAYQQVSVKRTVLNVSSGAGRHAIESWSTYCASKAAMDMFAEVFDFEQKLHYKTNPIKVFSVAPGIVDTQMQDEIRKVPKADFSEVVRFREYKEQKQLSDPISVAVKLREVILKPEKFDTCVLDVRDLSN